MERALVVSSIPYGSLARKAMLSRYVLLVVHLAHPLAQGETGVDTFPGTRLDLDAAAPDCRLQGNSLQLSRMH